MQEDNNKPLYIFLTDIQVHSNKCNNPKSFDRKIEKSIKAKKPGRFYSNETSLNKDGEIEFSIPLPKEAMGRKVILVYPKNGLSVSLGQDSKEKIRSLKK